MLVRPNSMENVIFFCAGLDWQIISILGGYFSGIIGAKFDVTDCAVFMTFHMIISYAPTTIL